MSQLKVTTDLCPNDHPVVWAGAPLAHWTQEASPYNQGMISYIKEVDDKTYRFTVDPHVRIQGFTEIANCTKTQITYSVFVPHTILDLRILQVSIKVVNITNFLDRDEFNKIYSQGEQYCNKILKNISEELCEAEPLRADSHRLGSIP